MENVGPHHIRFEPQPRGKKLIGAKGIATRNSDDTRGYWPYILLGTRTLLGAPGLTTRSKKLLGTRTLLGAKGLAMRASPIEPSGVDAQQSRCARASSIERTRCFGSPESEKGASQVWITFEKTQGT